MAEKLDLVALEQQANRVLSIPELGHSAHEDQRNIIALIARVRELQSDARDAQAYRRINTPEIDDFLSAVRNEMLHQRERWGAAGDAGKTDADWFWLLGYLGGKAIRAETLDKVLHHIITTAAACGNWHGQRTGHYADMRPGIASNDAVSNSEAA